MMMEPRMVALAILAIVLAVSAPGRVHAAPLDAETCAKLTEERGSLVAAGTPADMAQGPAWAKSNLTDDRLRRIARFITVDEQLNFRCGLAKQRIALPTTQEGGEELLPADGTSPSAPGQPAQAKTVAPSAPVVVPTTPAPAKRAKRAESAKTGDTKKATPKKAARAAPKGVEGTPAAERVKAAPKAKPAPRPRKKVDDAYRPPARGKAAQSPTAAPATTPATQ